ncbi:hypothetical protein SCACP_30090 [Sporomusa carbonis]|uniref:baseplate J/gp47 family protein n=1 Tax=Sporomusa carbonis TaxID=3076075 RepID=UPI003A751AB0
MFKTFAEILQALFDYIINTGTRKITDFNPGSLVRTILEAVAAVIEDCYFLLETLADKYFVLSSEGEWLDKRVQDYGMQRKPGTKSEGTIAAGRDSPAPFSCRIPAGTLFQSEGGVEVVTLEAAVLNTGELSVEIPAQAVNVGKDANFPAGTVLKQAGIAITGIEWAKVVRMEGGEDTESDDDLKARFLERMRNPGTSGNIADYVQWAREVAGVTAAHVVPIWDGPGTVKVIVLGPDKKPPSASIVQSVQDYIAPNNKGERKAPIGATVTVVGAAAVVINIETTVLLDNTQNIALATLQENFTAAVEDYLNKMAFQADVLRYSRVSSLLLDQAGVIDYIDFTINGETANISLSADEVAVLGEVKLYVA